MAARPLAILFDLDDTILDDSRGVETSWQVACAEAAAVLDGMAANDLRAAIERVRTWYWSDPERHRQGRADLRAASARIVQLALESLGCDRTDIARRTGHRYRALRDAAQQVLPGAVETLEHLRAAGIRLALVTNGAGDAQRAKLARFDLARHFDHVQIEGEFGVGKPDPRVYHAALRVLDAPPQRAWFVGDNLEWDVAAPQHLGLAAIWVDKAQRGLPSRSAIRPDHVVHTIAEVVILVREGNRGQAP
jgi:putative hydrolase of the HAD superfamily